MTVGGEQDRESEPGKKKSQKQHGKKPGEEATGKESADESVQIHSPHRNAAQSASPTDGKAVESCSFKYQGQHSAL